MTWDRNHRRRRTSEEMGARVGAVKIIGVIRSKETQIIEIEAGSYEEGQAQLDPQIPSGWQLQSVRTEK